MQSAEDISISKKLSWLLRHGAVGAGLEIVQGKYFIIDEILKLEQFREISCESIFRIVRTNNKRRFSLKIDETNGKMLICANQGHSMNVSDDDLTKISICDSGAAAVPSFVVHGSFIANWNNIKLEGLSRRSRNHIHFAPVEPFSSHKVISGFRKGCDLFIYINILAAMRHGIHFFRSKNDVILSPGNADGYIPIEYFQKVLYFPSASPSKKKSRIPIVLMNHETELDKGIENKDKSISIYLLHKVGPLASLLTFGGLPIKHCPLPTDIGKDSAPNTDVCCNAPLQTDDNSNLSKHVINIVSSFDKSASITNEFFCNTCHHKMHSRSEQVNHYQSKWHVTNLTRKLHGDDAHMPSTSSTKYTSKKVNSNDFEEVVRKSAQHIFRSPIDSSNFRVNVNKNNNLFNDAICGPNADIEFSDEDDDIEEYFSFSSSDSDDNFCYDDDDVNDEGIIGDDSSRISSHSSNKNTVENKGKSKNIFISDECRRDDKIERGNNRIESTSSSHRGYPKCFFRKENGNLLSLYRCVLYSKKAKPSTSELESILYTFLDIKRNTELYANQDLNKILQQLPYYQLPSLYTLNPTNWAIILLSGAHFAAAIYHGEEIVCHKTLRKYLIRKKRGTMQSTHDNQNAITNSAGAQLRRHCEEKLATEIRELLLKWHDELERCSRIFVRATGPRNKRILFSNKHLLRQNPSTRRNKFASPLNKNDLRIRSIPFMTRKATFVEVQRVHSELSVVQHFNDPSITVDKAIELARKLDKHSTADDIVYTKDNVSTNEQYYHSLGVTDNNEDTKTEAKLPAEETSYSDGSNNGSFEMIDDASVCEISSEWETIDLKERLEEFSISSPKRSGRK